MTRLRTIAMTVLASTLFLSTSWSAPCKTGVNGVMDSVFSANGRVNTWENDSSARYGIKNLLSNDSACFGCHSTPSAAAFKGTTTNGMVACAFCHSKNNPQQTSYPNWLDFTDPSVLRAGSYYRPGYTKAEASLIRVLDGTMPPGKAPGYWCDELVTWLQDWIVAGMP